MFAYLKNKLLNNCSHLNIRKTESKRWENKCDCCGKVLYAKEDSDFIVARNEKENNIFELKKGK